MLISVNATYGGKMVKINEMTEQEKSLALAKLLGWEYVRNGSELFIQPPEYPHDPYGRRIMTFYHPSCMEYAWRVLNWAILDEGGGRIWLKQPTPNSGRTHDVSLAYLIAEWQREWEPAYDEPAEAQAAWLDKILELAITAGLTTADGGNG